MKGLGILGEGQRPRCQGSEDMGPEVPRTKPAPTGPGARDVKTRYPAGAATGTSEGQNFARDDLKCLFGVGQLSFQVCHGFGLSITRLCHQRLDHKVVIVDFGLLSKNS